MKTALRMTPQTIAVLQVAQQLGHANNLQILVKVRQNFPTLTPTTVHRITSRLIENGLLAAGPQINGARLIDANTTVHDHFLCSDCDGIKDFNINSSVREAIKTELQIKKLPRSLTIYGDCDACL